MTGMIFPMPRSHCPWRCRTLCATAQTRLRRVDFLGPLCDCPNQATSSGFFGTMQQVMRSLKKQGVPCPIRWGNASILVPEQPPPNLSSSVQGVFMSSSVRGVFMSCGGLFHQALVDGFCQLPENAPSWQHKKGEDPSVLHLVLCQVECGTVLLPIERQLVWCLGSLAFEGLSALPTKTSDTPEEWNIQHCDIANLSRNSLMPRMWCCCDRMLIERERWRQIGLPN